MRITSAVKQKKRLFPSFSSLDPPKIMWNSGLESKARKLQKAVLWPVLPGKWTLESIYKDSHPIVSLTCTLIYPSVKWDAVIPIFTGLF